MNTKVIKKAQCPECGRLFDPDEISETSGMCIRCECDIENRNWFYWQETMNNIMQHFNRPSLPSPCR